MSIELAKFRRPVVPGEQMRLQITLLRNRGKVWKFRGEAFVDGAMAAEAEFTAMIIPPDDPRAQG
jgi:3-hydroxyacyl-[acyl-carrier-protein] dehydratase